MKRNAFTLVELLVVISIIGLLSTVAVVALGSSNMKARNAKRKADMIQISKALELYYSDNGAYPTTSGAWRGDCSSYGSYPNTGAGAWIPNLAPTYMAILPRDPNDGKGNTGSAQPVCATPGQNCLLYKSDGIDYDLLAHCTPEGTMSTSDPYYDAGRPYWAWEVSTPGGINY